MQYALTSKPVSIAKSITSIDITPFVKVHMAPASFCRNIQNCLNTAKSNDRSLSGESDFDQFER